MTATITVNLNESLSGDELAELLALLARRGSTLDTTAARALRREIVEARERGELPVSTTAKVNAA